MFARSHWVALAPTCNVSTFQLYYLWVSPARSPSQPISLVDVMHMRDGNKCCRQKGFSHLLCLANYIVPNTIIRAKSKFYGTFRRTPRLRCKRDDTSAKTLLLLALFRPQLDRLCIIHTTNSLEIESTKSCQLPIRPRLLHSGVGLQEAIRFVVAV
jgi:hypothetical protein